MNDFKALIGLGLLSFVPLGLNMVFNCLPNAEVLGYYQGHDGWREPMADGPRLMIFDFVQAVMAQVDI